MKIQTEPPFLRLHNSFHIIHTICQQLLCSYSLLQSLREPILQTGEACHKPPEESLTAWGWTRMSAHGVSQQGPECKVSPSSGMEQPVLQPGHWAPHLPPSTCLIGRSRPTQKRPRCSLQTRCGFRTMLQPTNKEASGFQAQNYSCDWWRPAVAFPKKRMHFSACITYSFGELTYNSAVCNYIFPPFEALLNCL